MTREKLKELQEKLDKIDEFKAFIDGVNKLKALNNENDGKYSLNYKLVVSVADEVEYKFKTEYIFDDVDFYVMNKHFIEKLKKMEDEFTVIVRRKLNATNNKSRWHGSNSYRHWWSYKNFIKTKKLNGT